jgi:hypothetical protein
VAGGLFVTGTQTTDGGSFGWWPLFGWGLALAILVAVVLGGRALDEQLARDSARNRSDRRRRG